MADEPVNQPDPLQSLSDSHLKRMQEIADTGFEKSKQLCDDVATTVRRHAGFKNDILDRALTSLGITDVT